jgi:F-type H+-transporting ATPase subunit gamma
VAGGKERVLRRRIGSVQNTKKITRAMELIAATRVVKAQQRARASRPYAEQITAVIENLAAGGAEVDHPLLRPAEKVDRTTRRLSRPPSARCRTPAPRAPTTR